MESNNYNIKREQSAGIIVYEHRGRMGDVNIIIMSLSKDPTDESKWLDGDRLMELESFKIEKVNKDE